MPLGPITIETGDPIPGTFTYTAVLGTTPYTYSVTFSGISGSGIVGNIGGAENNVVTFDGTLARAGTYTIEIRGKVTDDVGDVDQSNPDDIEYYFITVNPIVAAWDVAPTWNIGDLEQAATSATATLTVSGGGAGPFTYEFVWEGGAPPASGITIDQGGGPTDNSIEISTGGLTPPGSFSGAILGRVSDATGQTEVFRIPLTLTVLGMRNFEFSPSQIIATVGRGSDSASSQVINGTGGNAPYTYLFYFVKEAPGSLFSLVTTADTVAIGVDDNSPLQQFGVIVRCLVTDDLGQSIIVTPDMPFEITVSITGTWVEEIQALDPELWYRFNESSGTIVNQGNFSAGGFWDLTVVVGDPTYSVTGQVDDAITYDGNDAHERTPPTTNPWSTSGGTWLFIIKRDGAQGTNQAIAGFEDGGFNDQGIWFRCTVNDAHRITVAFQDGASSLSSVRANTDAGLVPDGAYALVGIVFEPPNDPELFLNGVNVASSTVNAPPPDVDFWLSDFGANFSRITAGRKSQFFDGLIGDLDEWVVFNGVQLTAAQQLTLKTAAGL